MLTLLAVSTSFQGRHCPNSSLSLSLSHCSLPYLSLALPRLPHINFVYVFAGNLLLFVQVLSKWLKVYHFRNEWEMQQVTPLPPTAVCSPSLSPSVLWRRGFKQNCAQTGNNGNAASFPLLLKHTFRVVSHPPLPSSLSTLSSCFPSAAAIFLSGAVAGCAALKFPLCVLL